MNGLQELYEDALDWLSFKQASDDIHWYAYRVVKAFEKEAQRIAKQKGVTPSSTVDSAAKCVSPVKEGKPC